MKLYEYVTIGIINYCNNIESDEFKLRLIFVYLVQVETF